MIGFVIMRMKQGINNHMHIPVIMKWDPKTKETQCITLREETYTTPFGTFIVPKGFVSDGASMPRFFWRFIGHPFAMDYLREAVLHDYFYRTQHIRRKLADKIFFNLLKNHLPFRSRLIYWSLRLFGWIAWNENKKKEKHL